MPDPKRSARQRPEQTTTPQPVEVAFVRFRRGARAAVQEWRSRSTGRVHEVPERQSYAPAAILDEGATGWLTYAGGVPWVGETQDESRRMAHRAAKGTPLTRGAEPSKPSRRTRVPWALLFALALLATIVWAMSR